MVGSLFNCKEGGKNGEGEMETSLCSDAALSPEYLRGSLLGRRCAD